MNEISWLDALPELGVTMGETLWMVTWSFLITVIFGLICGVGLRLTTSDGLTPHRMFSAIFGAILNLARSLPFLILMIALIPFTRLVVGTAYGPTPVIVPLSIGAIPFYARVVEAAIREVSDGKIEAAQVMGATVRQIVWKVMLPEALPSLISGGTLTLVTLIGYSTMAGAIGGGGVGDFAIRYGYQRNNTEVLMMAVAVLIVLVQVIQSTGDAIVRSLSHRRD